jgi:hypothetical protein
MRRDPDVFAAEVGNLVSSSRGYQSQYPMGSGARRGGQSRSHKKSRLQPFPEQAETSDRPTTGAPLPRHSNEVGGAAQSSPPRQSSPTSWSGNSSPNQSGGAAFEPPSHHPKDNDNVGDEQPPTAVSHPTEMEVDNLAAAVQPLSPEVVPDNPPLRDPVLSHHQKLEQSRTMTLEWTSFTRRARRRWRRRRKSQFSSRVWSLSIWMTATSLT